jgi:hypothetical protein
MAKVFDTEVLYVNDKNIQIQATGDGEFDFLDSNSNLVFSKTGYDESITSLSNDIYEKDVIVKSESIGASASTKEVLFNTSNFTAQPSVVGLMSSSAANDPVIDSQLLEVTASNAKFALSDDLPSSDYKINLLIKGVRSQSLWTPASLGTNLEMWYDFSDSSTITHSSNTVSQVDDKSAKGLNLTVPTTDFENATGPTANTSTINNVGAVKFDHNNLYNPIATALGFTDNSPLYLSLLMQVKATDYQFHFALSDSTVGDRLYFRTNGPLQLQNTASLTNMPTPSIDDIVLVTIKLADTSSIWVDGALIDDSFTTSRSNVTDLHIGSNEQNVNGSESLYGDFMMYRDSSNHEKIEGYLAHKWGVAGSLPSSHTYKSDRPS